VLALLVTLSDRLRKAGTAGLPGFSRAIGIAQACTRGPQGSEARHRGFNLASPLAPLHVSGSSERSCQTTRRGSGANLPGISLRWPILVGECSLVRRSPDAILGLADLASLDTAARVWERWDFRAAPARRPACPCCHVGFASDRLVLAHDVKRCKAPFGGV
jgi:hypothetical protein